LKKTTKLFLLFLKIDYVFNENQIKIAKTAIILPKIQNAKKKKCKRLANTGLL